MKKKAIRSSAPGNGHREHHHQQRCGVLLGVDPIQITGRGAGLSDEGWREVDAIQRAITINQPDK